MNLRLNRALFPVTTLGYGRRLGLWTQGCSIRCAGCVSRDTWEPAGGFEIAPSELVAACGSWLRQADGVTLTGGEPTEQPAAVVELLRILHACFDGDILLYSGRDFAELGDHPIVREKLVDVLISGPYDESAGQTLLLRGSDNQRAHLLTERALSRYPEDLDTQPWRGRRKLDFFPGEDGVVMDGIPMPGWGNRLCDSMSRRGFTANTSEQRKISTAETSKR